MSGPKDFFTEDHRRCDTLWAAVEAAADGGDAATLQAAWAPFAAAMERHFKMEEEVLFPTFERATGMRGGPTMVMRAEHTQMRGLLAQMAEAAAAGEIDDVVDHGDTLLMLTQQHNVKEEGILYPMSEQVLGHMWAEIEAQLEAY